MKNHSKTKIIFGILAGIGLAFIFLPLVGLIYQAPWAHWQKHFLAPETLQALWISIQVSLIASFLIFIFGFPLAWFLAHLQFKGKNIIRTVIAAPMVLPPVVSGMALFSAFGTKGLLGGTFESLGIDIPFSMSAAVFASAFVAAPFFIFALEAGIRGLPPQLEAVAGTMGASFPRTLFSIILPSLKNSILAGLTLSWARSIGEFGATITFAGNSQGKTQTLPLAIYETLQSNWEGAMAISLLLLVLSLTVIFLFRNYIRLP